MPGLRPHPDAANSWHEGVVIAAKNQVPNLINRDIEITLKKGGSTQPLPQGCAVQGPNHGRDDHGQAPVLTKKMQGKSGVLIKVTAHPHKVSLEQPHLSYERHFAHQSSSCNTGAGGEGVIVPPRDCTATTADVVDLSTCARGSSEQCFFGSVELAELSAPGLRLQGSTCSDGSCADSLSAGEFVVPVAGVQINVVASTLARAGLGEHKISCLVVPQPAQSPNFN